MIEILKKLVKRIRPGVDTFRKIYHISWDAPFLETVFISVVMLPFYSLGAQSRIFSDGYFLFYGGVSDFKSYDSPTVRDYKSFLHNSYLYDSVRNGGASPLLQRPGTAEIKSGINSSYGMEMYLEKIGVRLFYRNEFLKSDISPGMLSEGTGRFFPGALYSSGNNGRPDNHMWTAGTGIYFPRSSERSFRPGLLIYNFYMKENFQTMSYFTANRKNSAGILTDKILYDGWFRVNKPAAGLALDVDASDDMTFSLSILPVRADGRSEMHYAVFREEKTAAATDQSEKYSASKRNIYFSGSVVRGEFLLHSGPGGVRVGFDSRRILMKQIDASGALYSDKPFANYPEELFLLKNATDTHSTFTANTFYLHIFLGFNFSENSD